MATQPNKGSGSKLFNIMSYVRGNIDLPNSATTSKTKAFGGEELISQKQRSAILSGAFRATETQQTQQLSQASILTLVKNSLAAVGKTRAENRKILHLMPNVEKAARLMTATIMSPNDLSRGEVRVIFDLEEDIPEEFRLELGNMATEFFQQKLNLRSSIPSWIYQAGYESGATVHAIIPMRSFGKIESGTYLGTESFVKTIVDTAATESLFGFGDDGKETQSKDDIVGLESFTDNVFKAHKPKADNKVAQSDVLRKFIGDVLGQESLALTDNPSVLQAPSEATKHNRKRAKEKIRSRFRVSEQTVVSLSSSTKTESDEELGVVGNPIFMRLPTESVTVIHTPGDPNDHQGYLILLDRQGNPIDAVTEQENNNQIVGRTDYANLQSDVFNQVYSAYGFSNYGRQSQEEMMGEIYNQIVTEHLRRRMDKAGFANVEIANVDGVMRCMFARFLQRKQTRVLFLPEELVNYFAFELDQQGYGVSRLERIKFSLGMKMAIQVSRAMAAVKAAMDKRRVEVKFTENMIDQPEQVLNSIVQEYLRKSTVNFSIDPNVIQNQIADKSLSIKATEIPGMETFELINEPDSRSGSFDFDPTMMQQLDDEIINGLKIPAATMNSLGEDEYARSVSTTNLFFSMEVSIDQDITIEKVSDLIRKYATYSEEFINKIYEIVPTLKTRSKQKTKGESSLDDNIVMDKDTKIEQNDIPEDYTLDTVIESMKISLPSPNIAPSKAQFESIEAMVSAITNMVNSLFPDDLIGQDDTLGPVVRLLRARFIATNIRNYMDSAGLSDITVPEVNFSDYLSDTGEMIQGLNNFAAMLSDKTKIVKPDAALEAPIDGMTAPSGF